MKETKPAVFVFDEIYEILIPAETKSLLHIECGGRKYYDAVNGVLRSDTEVHRVKLPKEALDKAGEYTVVERNVIDRCPYFPTSEAEVRTTFRFKAPDESGCRAYCISDTHGMRDEALMAAKAFGKIDFLILLGDLADCADSVRRFENTFDIAFEITHGEIPIVYVRGNHDLRGAAAEKQAEYLPCSVGNTYYTFRLGSIHGIVLDCGEDKDDSSEEYGGTVCFHDYRLAETDYLRCVCKQGVFKEGEHRIVLCHIPFTYRRGAEFNIERKLYFEWAHLLKDHIKPELMICGHLHRAFSSPVGSAWDHLGQPCPVIITSEKASGYFCGCGLTFGKDGIKATFTDSLGSIRATASSPDFVFTSNDGKEIPEKL